MTADLIYNQLADYYTEGNVKKLEEMLGFGNSAIGKAIGRKSIIKPAMIDTILQTFPDVNRNWLLTGAGEMIIANQSLPSFKEEGKDYRTLFEEALINDNKKIHALSDTILDLINGVKKDLMSLKSELRYYAQTQTDNQKVLHTGMQNLLGVFFPDQPPLSIVDNKSFLQGAEPQPGSNPESEGN